MFLLFSFISLVDAKVLNTKVNIDDEGYEKLIGYMSENEMALISQDIYDMFMVKNVVSYESYIVETTYYESPTQLPKKINERHMTVDEYVNMSSTDEYECFFNVDTDSFDCDTQMKYLSLAVCEDIDGIYFYFYNNWDVMPKYKSFDVMAIRWTGDFTYDTYFGEQNTNGNTEYVSYNVGNGNYKIGTKAIGLSQNLVDSATMIENKLIVSGSCSTGGRVYASYQHAQANITLATSKKYNFSSSGMGGIFEFYDGVGSYYDNTPGLSMIYSC